MWRHTHLFGYENTEVAILLIDFVAECHEAKEVETESEAPSHQLPVAKVIEECFGAVQKLLEQHASKDEEGTEVEGK